MLQLALQGCDGDDGVGISAWMVPHHEASDEEMEASGQEEDYGENDDDDHDAWVDLSFSEATRLVEHMPSQAGIATQAMDDGPSSTSSSTHRRPN